MPSFTVVLSFLITLVPGAKTVHTAHITGYSETLFSFVCSINICRILATAAKEHEQTPTVRDYRYEKAGNRSRIFGYVTTTVVRVVAGDDSQSQKFSGSLDEVGNIVMLSGRHVDSIDLNFHSNQRGDQKLIIEMRNPNVAWSILLRTLLAFNVIFCTKVKGRPR